MPNTARVLPLADIANPDLQVGRAARVRGIRELRSVRRPRGATDVVLDLGLVGQLVRPAAVRIEHVELMELVTVVICAEHDPAVGRRHAHSPHRLVGERGQLGRPATLDRNAPEVELPGDVAREEEMHPVGGERQNRGEAADREELLHERQLSRFCDSHGAEITVLRHGKVSALGVVHGSRGPPA